VGAVDECLGEIELAALFEIFGERAEDAFERAVAHPVLKSAMAGLIRRIPRGHVLPRRAGAKDPQHAVQDVSRIAIRPPPYTELRRFLDGEQRTQQRPLVFGEVHPNL
jgi:hypothetical protein